MTDKLEYEDPTGQLASLKPLIERVKNLSRRRILKAFEEALNEFIILDEGGRTKD